MPSEFECFCGEAFASRLHLIEHNVEAHSMDDLESRRLVLEKYPS